jgi:L-threonylcarbamoyladenylate synthase
MRIRPSKDSGELEMKGFPDLTTSASQIAKAVKILRAGGLVAFPTETVYGLGADARNESAIAKIFHAKGRPSTNPLIVHVADSNVAKRYAKTWPDAAEQLARELWPGPITLVLPKSSDIVSSVTAGRDTVGLRAPNHPLALRLLEDFDGPLAGPSANKSNRVSPTTAEHVRQSLGSAVDLILDGGPCAIGIESTVLDLSSKTPRILRPGGISRDIIEKIIGPVELTTEIVDASKPAASPGQHAVHYAPSTRAYRFEANQSSIVSNWQSRHADKECTIITFDTPSDFARLLYHKLHEADEKRVDAIWIELPPDDPQWHAVRDRIIRATRPAEEAR